MTEILKCPSCGAPLDVQQREGPIVRCAYCDHSIMLPEALQEEKEIEQPFDSASISIGSVSTPGFEQIMRLRNVAQLARSGQKKEAVELYHKTFGVGLKEAKRVVDAIAAGQPVMLGGPSVSISTLTTMQQMMGKSSRSIFQSCAGYIFTAILLIILTAVCISLFYDIPPEALLDIVRQFIPETYPDVLIQETSVPASEFTDTPLAEANFSLLDCDLGPVASAQAGRPYQIQAGDQLSLIAEREYGNPLDYRAIVAINNQRCQVDSTFNCIDKPGQIRVGWTIYLPTADEVNAYWNEQLVSLPPADWNTTAEINITGSSTMYPLTRQLAYCFQQAGFNGAINLESTGTLVGFEKFCAGEADVVNASYPMSQADRALCQRNGLTPVEFQVGTDALAIVVSSQNDFVDEVTPAELKQILATADMWSKVRPEWPAEPIKRYFPTEKSGTFASLVEVLFAGDPTALLNTSNIVKQSEDDQELVAGIQNDPWAIGFLGHAYYKQNQDTLRTLPVNGIKPLPETVDQGTYPLLRPLFVYSAVETMQHEPLVNSFISFYLGNVKNYITDVGYFLPNEGAFRQAIQNLNEAAPLK
jgi:phosphate transport system substrate-binding protein